MREQYIRIQAKSPSVLILRLQARVPTPVQIKICRVALTWMVWCSSPAPGKTWASCMFLGIIEGAPSRLRRTQTLVFFGELFNERHALLRGLNDYCLQEFLLSCNNPWPQMLNCSGSGSKLSSLLWYQQGTLRDHAAQRRPL